LNYSFVYEADVLILFLFLQKHVSEQHDMLFQTDSLLFGLQGTCKEIRSYLTGFFQQGHYLRPLWTHSNTKTEWTINKNYPFQLWKWTQHLL